MPVVATDPRLPFELISKVLDDVNISALMRLSRVCRAWRRAARAHSVFWRNIRLDLTKATQLDFFLFRLGAHTACVQLDIAFRAYHVRTRRHPPEDEVELAQQFRAVLLPALERNLSRISSLRLTFDDDLSLEICATLMQPAPMLEDLHLESRWKEDTVPSLPDAFLGGCAPRLKNACFSRFVLPESAHAITAFRNVESLGWQNKDCSLQSLFLHFPAVKHLYISADTFVEDGAHMIFSGRPLTTLDVGEKGNIAALLSCFSPAYFAAIPSLTCDAESSRGQLRKLLSALDGPLTLTVRDDGRRQNVCAELSSSDLITNGERLRTFHLPQSGVYGDVGDSMWRLVQSELFTPDLLARVVRFRLHGRNAGIVPDIGEALPACKVLELGFDDTRDRRRARTHPLVAVRSVNASREPYALQFPAVRTVICTPNKPSPEGPVLVSAEELSGLLARVIRPRPSPLNVIELAGVQLTGDVAALEREHGCSVVKKDI